MKSIFLLFWRICIFQRGPETIPAQGIFFAVVTLANALLNIGVQISLGGEDTNLLRAITFAVVGLACTGGLIWIVMMLMSLTQRAPQTIAATFGVDIIMTSLTAAALATGDLIGLGAARFAVTLLTLWSLGVYGFIFHKALNIHIGFGVAMALFVAVFSVAITQTALVP